MVVVLKRSSIVQTSHVRLPSNYDAMGTWALTRLWIMLISLDCTEVMVYSSLWILQDFLHQP